MLTSARPRPGLLVLLLAAVGCGDTAGPGTDECLTDCPQPTPPTGTWSTAAPMPTARREMPAVRMGGRIFIIGGLDMGDRILSTIEAYLPESHIWQTMPDLPEPRHHHGVAAVGGKVYVIGGYGTGGPPPWTPTRTVFELDPVSRTWRERAQLPILLAAMAVAEVDGKIYVFGGTAGREAFSGTLIYDPRRHVVGRRADAHAA